MKFNALAFQIILIFNIDGLNGQGSEKNVERVRYTREAIFPPLQDKQPNRGLSGGRDLHQYVLLNSDGSFSVRDLIPSFSAIQEQKISNGIIVNDGGLQGRILHSGSTGESPILILESQQLDQIPQDTKLNIQKNKRGLLKPIPLSSFESTKIVRDSYEDLRNGGDNIDISKEIFLPVSPGSLNQQPIQRGGGTDRFRIGTNQDLIQQVNGHVHPVDRASIFLHVSNEGQRAKKIKDILDSHEDLLDDSFRVNVPATIAVPHPILTPPKSISQNFAQNNPNPQFEINPNVNYKRRDLHELHQISKPDSNEHFGELSTAKLLTPLHRTRNIEPRILTHGHPTPHHDHHNYHNHVPTNHHQHYYHNDQGRESDLASYSFGYKVTGNEGATHGHTEERNGDRVDGMYHVDLPNGYRQIVRYYADETGYHPTITYEKLDHNDEGFSNTLPHLHEHTHIHRHKNEEGNHFPETPNFNIQNRNIGSFALKKHHPSPDLETPSYEDPNDSSEFASAESRVWSRPTHGHEYRRSYFDQHTPRFDQPAYFVRDSRKYNYN